VSFVVIPLAWVRSRRSYGLSIYHSNTPQHTSHTFLTPFCPHRYAADVACPRGAPSLLAPHSARFVLHSRRVVSHLGLTHNGVPLLSGRGFGHAGVRGDTIMTAAGSLFFGTLIAEVAVDYKVMPRTTRTTTFPVRFAIVVLIPPPPPQHPQSTCKRTSACSTLPASRPRKPLRPSCPAPKCVFLHSFATRLVCCHLVVREAVPDLDGLCLS
jgi:hypothetical protein